eukprot:9712471-Alexandrium_andersonii.AAC.1
MMFMLGSISFVQPAQYSLGAHLGAPEGCFASVAGHVWSRDPLRAPIDFRVLPRQQHKHLYYCFGRRSVHN